MGRRGFSLVELSIVLVILGLLTGGILGGQALIKEAELRSVSVEFEQWQTAVNTFRQRYFAIPGDFGKAGKVWGYADTGGTGGTCANPNTNTGDSPLTCDGNGNGTLDTNNEMFRFWQHLANAGLVPGTYTGVAADGAQDTVIGVNVPVSRFSGGGWMARWLGDSPGLEGFLFAYDYGNPFSVGGQWPGLMALLPLFAPEQAWNIDMKFDDGRPAKGKVVSSQSTNCTDAADRNDVDAEYMLTDTGQRCVLMFVKAF